MRTGPRSGSKRPGSDTWNIAHCELLPGWAAVLFALGTYPQGYWQVMGKAGSNRKRASREF